MDQLFLVSVPARSPLSSVLAPTQLEKLLTIMACSPDDLYKDFPHLLACFLSVLASAPPLMPSLRRNVNLREPQ
ncbi:uncharacterized protein LAESUDRAFT_762374 [Laetiporus sulphureus 93-53]|uniref:Uncharacterized protein n=1 Tax=Laetiporus sulphureus 93-53 TaxID=1314785 RepID=A0A165CJZ7_9APHY|nr:uncharacterized protein LAESUDRAFT_762374 [Laetiporus sulphureus 93-53]KZT02948.1 hypothetical protein LAESUDRAFT_762374 [Laetiporus sulphureus 93-53]